MAVGGRRPEVGLCRPSFAVHRRPRNRSPFAGGRLPFILS
jgi:hypothetical protein